MTKIKKAVFLVAGFGTRFLPISKAVPKHMLPIVDKPILQYLVEEAVDAGIEDIIFVTGRGKNAIEDHFDTSYELEQTLIGKGKTEILEKVETISKLANFAYTRQSIPKGDGDALLHATAFIGDEPILVVFPDYIMPDKNQTFKRLIEFYEKTGMPIIATDTIPLELTTSFGVIDLDKEFNQYDDSGVLKVKGFVEKPKSNPPSDMINLGHAVMTPELINMISQSQSTVSDGELRIADTFIKYLKEGGQLYALKADFGGYDCGNAIGLLKANIATALERKDTKDELKEFLKNILK
jgi:UTP--glucose-1-phosphate uridylyltransferase